MSSKSARLSPSTKSRKKEETEKMDVMPLVWETNGKWAAQRAQCGRVKTGFLTVLHCWKAPSWRVSIRLEEEAALVACLTEGDHAWPLVERHCRLWSWPVGCPEPVFLFDSAAQRSRATTLWLGDPDLVDPSADASAPHLSTSLSLLSLLHVLLT